MPKIYLTIINVIKNLIIRLKAFFHSNKVLSHANTNKVLNKENNQQSVDNNSLEKNQLTSDLSNQQQIKNIFLTFKREKILQTSIQKYLNLLD